MTVKAGTVTRNEQQRVAPAQDYTKTTPKKVIEGILEDSRVAPTRYADQAKVPHGGE